MLGYRGENGAAEADAVDLTNENVTNLSQSVAQTIGLPPLAPLSVTLSFDGRVESVDGSIQEKWYDESTRQVLVKRTGGFIEWGDKRGRLAADIYVLMDAVDRFNATSGQSVEARIAAWGPVQTALKVVTGKTVETDQYLGSLSIYQAGSFALDVRETDDGPDLFANSNGSRSIGRK